MFNPRDTNTQILSEEELEHKFLQLFRRMSICAATHQGKDAEWIDGQCVTPTTATAEALTLFARQAEAVAREAERNLIDQILEDVSHDPNPTTWALQAKLATLNQEKP